MPNRIIKESAFTSERIAKLSDFAFRLWVGLITQADDTGRGDARPAIIKGRVFALRDRVSLRDIDAALHALAAGGCVSLYTVGGKPYYQFPHWAEHQRVRNVVSKHPGPEEADDAADCGDIPHPAASCGELPQVAASCGLNPIQSESNPNPNPKSARTQFVPPTLDEVRDYCAERSSPVDPVQFFEYFSEGNWKDSKGNPVRNWKQKLITWEKFQNEKPKKTGTAAELEESYEMMRRWANG